MYAAPYIALRMFTSIIAIFFVGDIYNAFILYGPGIYHSRNTIHLVEVAIKNKGGSSTLRSNFILHCGAL